MKPQHADPASDLAEAYAACVRIARGHYENFPVASVLLPSRLRPHVAAVYAFARHADDLADEGGDPSGVRLAKLEHWGSLLDACTRPDFGSDSSLLKTERDIFLALGDTIGRFAIPKALFEDLLSAFRQDAVQERYATFADVLDYCRRSANPVGRIMLALFGRLDAETAPASDALCTGLQLANFWQDVSMDLRIPRVYIPEEDFERFGVDREAFARGEGTDAVRELLRFETERARSFFIAALPLFPLVPWRLRLELRAIWAGGMRILDKIGQVEYNTLQYRPALTSLDALRIMAAAVRNPRTR
jgi:phytoene synthase